jgi:hypothetical protein
MTNNQVKPIRGRRSVLKAAVDVPKLVEPVSPTLVVKTETAMPYPKMNLGEEIAFYEENVVDLRIVKLLEVTGFRAVVLDEKEDELYVVSRTTGMLVDKPKNMPYWQMVSDDYERMNKTWPLPLH